MQKFKSRRFLLTLFTKLAGAYLISQGQIEAGTALIGVAGGTYNVGQSLEDAAKAKVREAISSRLPELTRSES